MTPEEIIKHLKTIENEIDYLNGYVSGVRLQVESRAKMSAVDPDSMNKME